MQQQLEATLKAKFPEIDRVFARTGTAEIASDPMPPEHFRRLHHAQAGVRVAEPRKSRDELLAAIQEVVGRCRATTRVLAAYPLRFNELIQGSRSDVAVKIFSDGMDVLNKDR